MKTHIHKKEHKKPKGTKPGSRKGQLQQRLFETIRQAKEDGSAWATHPAPKCCYTQGGGEMWRLKIEPPTADNIPEYLTRDAMWAFLRCRKGIGLFEIHDYKGERLVAFTGGDAVYRTISEDDILAIVVEQHLREEES